MSNQPWMNLLMCDPDEADEELIGLLDSEFYNPPVASRMHVASCDGVSQVHVELNIGDRTLTFYLNTRDADDTLYSLATALGKEMPA